MSDHLFHFSITGRYDAENEDHADARLTILQDEIKELLEKHAFVKAGSVEPRQVRLGSKKAP